MQSLSSKHRQGFRSGIWEARRLGLEAGAVDRIAHERMAQMGEMDPDLMGAAGFETAGEEARDRLAVCAVVGLEPLPMSNCLAPIRPHRHLVPSMRMPAERLVDAALRPVEDAPHEGQ